MNKYNEELNKAKDDFYDAYKSTSRTMYWSLTDSEYYKAYLVCDSVSWSLHESRCHLTSRTSYISHYSILADNNQLNYQIDKVLELL